MPRKGSYYHTLGLEENCTPKEIKTAYVTLSKRFHPDKRPDDPDHNKNFVKINEAYSILRKPETRKLYDISLRHENYGDPYFKTAYTAPPVWRDESIWYMRDRRNDSKESRHYYGIPGIKRLPNLWIAGGTVLIMAIGAYLHYVAIKSGTTFALEQLNLRDRRLSTELSKARKTAVLNGNNLQLKILQDKLEETNPED